MHELGLKLVDGRTRYTIRGEAVMKTTPNYESVQRVPFAIRPRPGLIPIHRSYLVAVDSWTDPIGQQAETGPLTLYVGQAG